LEYDRTGINVVKTYYKGKCPPKGQEWRKYETQRVTKEQLEKWFGPDSGYSNISAVTGPVSGGLTALDFDSPKAYTWWKQKYPEWAGKLPTSKSGRGYHVFFRSTLTKDDTTSYSQIHIKAKGLVSLPPSVHENDARYEWVNPLPESIDQLALLNPHEWNLGEFTDGNDGIDGSEGNDGNEGVGKRGVRLRFGDLSRESQVAITDAIEQTRPKRYGERYRLIFLFCRILKKMDELKDKSAEELMEVADMWHESAKSNIKTKSLTMTRIRFTDAWEDAKYPPGEGKSLDIAWENAQNSTMAMPELQDYKDDPLIQMVIRLCFALQELAGANDDWFLPTNRGPKLLGISHSWLATLLNHLHARRIIKKTRGHTKTRCARYRYVGPSAKFLRKQTA
jgi:hypothetical protein